MNNFKKGDEIKFVSGICGELIGRIQYISVDRKSGLKFARIHSSSNGHYSRYLKHIRRINQWHKITI